MASLLVQAYPAVPDALAVASAVIADMSEKGETLPAKIANLPMLDGINGLSVAPPLLCPPGEQNANAPTTAAAAAAAAAAAGVSQGAAIGLGISSSQPPLLQRLQSQPGQPQPSHNNSNNMGNGLLSEALTAAGLNGWSSSLS